MLTPWPAAPARIHLSNRETIARLGRIEVFTLPYVARPDPELLAVAGGALPLDRWV